MSNTQGKVANYTNYTSTKIEDLNLEEIEGLIENLSEKKQRFLKLYDESAMSISAACDKLNIHRQTYYYWRRTDPVFAMLAKDVREAKIDWVQTKLFEKIEKGDITAIIFFLKCQGQSRGYIDKPRLHLHAHQYVKKEDLKQIEIPEEIQKEVQTEATVEDTDDNSQT